MIYVYFAYLCSYLFVGLFLACISDISFFDLSLCQFVNDLCIFYSVVFFLFFESFACAGYGRMRLVFLKRSAASTSRRKPEFLDWISSLQCTCPLVGVFSRSFWLVWSVWLSHALLCNPRSRLSHLRQLPSKLLQNSHLRPCKLLGPDPQKFYLVTSPWCQVHFGFLQLHFPSRG